MRRTTWLGLGLFGLLGLLGWMAAGCGDGSAAPPCKASGCDGARLCAVPADPAEPGPWPVGARQLRIDGLTTEVWYPAAFGSERKAERVVYDVRQVLPPEEVDKIPDADNPYQSCDCYRDLPPDLKRGPYPVVIFIHGTAGYRMQSLSQMVHWASRGFVVLAADHPGLFLADMLLLELESDLPGDVRSLVAALDQPDGPLGFLAGALDSSRIALSGHSAGGMAAGEMTGLDGVRVVIPMAAEGVEPGPDLQAVLIMGGLADEAVPFERQQAGYEASPAPKHLVGIAGAGHLVFSELCALTNDAGQDVVTIAVEHGVTNAELAGQLFDCAVQTIDDEEGWRIVNAYTAALLEQQLHCCADRAAVLAGLAERFAAVTSYRFAASDD
jgi:predicted dienelactone hydrolase